MQTDDTIENYNKSASEYAKSRIGTEDIEELQAFAKLLPVNAKILDVGCAAGRDTYILTQMGFDVTGTDLAKKLLEIAKKSYPDITFVSADMRKLPFENGAFGAIWASAVLHHVPRNEIDTVLAEFKRVLAPAGILYIHTKTGQGTLETKEAIVSNLSRSFTLITAEELVDSLEKHQYSKLSISEKTSRSRENLKWLNAMYKKG